MFSQSRFYSSLIFSGKHLFVGMLVAIIPAYLVFFLWYPYPYDRISGGRALFQILIIVDILCGPLLSFVIYNKLKKKKELIVDLSIVISIQFMALCYGLYSVMLARPVFLAYEGDRFRVVSFADISDEDLNLAKDGVPKVSLGEPKLIAVRLSKSTDKDFVDSIKQSLDGRPPSFRPERWEDYNSYKNIILQNVKPFEQLITLKNTEKLNHVLQVLKNFKKSELGYFPLIGFNTDSWVIIIDRISAKPVAFAEIDGW